MAVARGITAPGSGVRLAVGPVRILEQGPYREMARRSEERMAALKAAWARLEAAVPGALHGLPPEFIEYPHGQVAGGCAHTVPRLGPGFAPYEHIWIAVDDSFFAASPNAQTLTLLHECGHAWSVLGPLRERTVESTSLWDQMEPRGSGEQQVDAFRFERRALAFRFRALVDELFAEQVVQRQAAVLASDRLRMLREMGEDGVATLSAPKDGHPLTPYRLFYAVLRLDQGTSLSKSPSDRLAFEIMAQNVLTILNGHACGKSLERLRPAFIAVNVDQVAPDFRPFDDMFDRVLGTELTSQ